jgi:quinol monooxygenase YgiN
MQNANRLAFTVIWEADEGNAEAAADIIARFIPEARKEPGLELLMVNRSADNPSQFLFYEIFRGEAAFAAHQETSHFKRLILQDALPLLKKRERIQYMTL